MKVVFFTTGKVFDNANATGGSKRFLELYNGFQDQNVDVILCSADDSSIAELEGKQHVQLPRAKQRKNGYLPREIYNFRTNWKILREIKKLNYDELIVFDVPNCIGLVLAGVKNINLFIRQDLIGYKKLQYSESNTKGLAKNLNLLIFKASETLSFLIAKRIHVQCDYDYSKLLKRHPLIAPSIKRKTTVQINNVNPYWIVENSRIAKENMFSPIFDNDFFTICYVGDFSSNRKGYKLAIDLLQKLTNQEVYFNALLVGGGKNLETCRDLFKENHNVVFTGRVANPALFLLQSNLCIVPSYEDSCPNTVLEALYNQIPVIGSRSGGIPEILSDSDWLFKPIATELFDIVSLTMNDMYYARLKENQLIRREQLFFEWSERIFEFITSQTKNTGALD